jgi:hypothetical protein
VTLRIIGPSASDGVVKALDSDLPAMLAEASAAKGSAADAVRANWRTLSSISLVSSQSTAPATQLVGPAANECTNGADCLDQTFTKKLRELHGKLGADRKLPEPPASFFVRTIGSDDLLIMRLVNELRLRGADPCGPGRLILFNEWDSIYARTFANGLRRQLDLLNCGKAKAKAKVDPYPYFRGLDGATLEGAPSQPKRVEGGDRSGKPQQIEWAEGPDQRDYVRRLAQQILESIVWSDPDSQVLAIGLIGSDVHDKLVLIQALRDAFPDRMLFTTDLDARLLHPSVTRYTRNLIVASSLPLRFRNSPLPPFRDSYQTAMYLAAQRAVMLDNGSPSSSATSAQCTDDDGSLKCHLHRAVTQPYLFEIGRRNMVQLNGPGMPTAPEEKQDRHAYAELTAVGLLVLAGLMMFGLPGPAMSAALSWRFASVPNDRFHLSIMGIAGLQMAALGFAAGMVVELWTPGSFGASGTTLLGLTLMALMLAFLYPGMPRRRDFHGIRSTLWRVAQIAALLLFLWWMASSFWEVVTHTQPSDTESGEPFAPLSGTSGWPGQIFRTLLIVLFTWFLDYTWFRVVDVASRIEDEYFAGESGVSGPPRPGRIMRILRAIPNSSILLWRPKVVLAGGGIDGSRLWSEYRLRLRNWPRFGRLVLAVFVLAIVLLLVNKAIGGSIPVIPVRGIGDRELIEVTMYLHGLAVASLLVLVGDATILTWRFITVLRNGRTVYPRATIRHFAAELGPDLSDAAGRPIVPQIVEREKFAEADAKPAVDGAEMRADGSARNSLLDDWIDVRLLAEHTAAIGPLIVFPFILVALMIVARSQLFDNWQIGGSVLFVLLLYVLWAVGIAFLLNFGAEVARRRAIDRMEADLLWLQGAGPRASKLAERFPTLIDQVRNMRKGAFAPFFEQPLVQAMLVPLGGAGGIQLIEFLLYARTQ